MFDRDDVYKIISDYAEENSESITVDLSENKKVYEMYKNLMTENTNKNKTEMEQISLIEDIILGRNAFGKGGILDGKEKESWDRIYNDHSDNKHMNYFDNVLAEGERDKIIKALSRNGLSTDVLRGIRKNQSFEGSSNGVQVIQEMGETEDGSPQVVYFEIKYNGKTIYNFSREKDVIPQTRRDIEDVARDLYDYSDEYSDSLKTRYRKKTNTANGKVFEDLGVTSKGNIVKRIMGYYKDSKGKRRFGFIGGSKI